MRKKVLMGLISLAACAALAGCGTSAKEKKAETGSVEANTSESEAAQSAETGLTEETAQPSEKESKTEEGAADTEIYRAFYDIVSDADPGEWDGFQLIDLDGDGIFELFATCIDGEREDPGIQPYMIVGHNDEGVVVNDQLYDGVAGAGGYRGSLYFLEGTGKLHESMAYAPFGVPSDRVYLIMDGEITETDMGEFAVDTEAAPESDDWDPFENGQWLWNGSPVTEDDYENSLKEATDNMDGKALSEMDWMGKDGALEQLQSLIG